MAHGHGVLIGPSGTYAGVWSQGMQTVGVYTWYVGAKYEVCTPQYIIFHYQRIYLMNLFNFLVFHDSLRYQTPKSEERHGLRARNKAWVGTLS